MQKQRFSFKRSNTSFDCYDCQKYVLTDDEFVWDNYRNVRICLPCSEKLRDTLKDDDDAKPKRSRWTSGMILKPWEMSPPDYDINSWPEELQREYVQLSSSSSQYKIGLAQAQAGLSAGIK
jgi:hypothetical protein